MHLITGCDAVGTSSSWDGWAYFALPEPLIREFGREAAKILGDTSLSQFHGKDYRRRYADNYKAFLRLIAGKLIKGETGAAAFALFGPEFRQDLIAFIEKAIGKAAGRTPLKDAIGGEELIAAIKTYSFPSMTMLNVMDGLGADKVVTAYLDDDERHPDLQTVSCQIDGHAIRGSAILKACMRAYQKARFPSSPSPSDSPFHIRKAKHDFLIQAADMIGNFGMASLFNKIGRHSNTNDEKAQIFRDVFGDVFADFAVDQVELVDDDIRIKGAGVLKFRLQLT